jgi:SAM-dependent methyltransferase
MLYFATGRQIAEAFAGVAAWRFGGLPAALSVLDFASGYGRTTRHLVRALPAARLTVAEIDPAAVAFQRETFGVAGAASGTAPSSLEIAETFDAVFAASFFSHLPEPRFTAWLERLHGLVRPGGVLVFSVHGMELLTDPRADRSRGIAFEAVSETTRLEGAEYGTSYVTEAFVRGVARRVAGEVARLLAFPLGLCGHQDLYALARPPLPSGPDPHLPRVPLGALESASVVGGVAAASGWAAGASDEPPPSVRLVLGGRVAETSPGAGPSGARRDWSFAFPVDAISPDAVVRVEAESARGRTKILVAETLRPYLPPM